MAKWYEYLPNLEKPVSKYIEKTFVPEKMSWWQKPAFWSAGIMDKKDMEENAWLGDLGSRGWLGSVNQRSRGVEGEEAYQGSSTTKGLKITGTIAAALAAMYGGYSAYGAMGTGGSGGEAAGAGANWTQYLKYLKYANMLQGQGGGGQQQNPYAQQQQLQAQQQKLQQDQESRRKMEEFIRQMEEQKAKEDLMYNAMRQQRSGFNWSKR